MDCRKQFPAICMDFDHIPEMGTKKANISSMVSRGNSYEAIEAEIAKCELVCANCHRMRTHARTFGQDGDFMGFPRESKNNAIEELRRRHYPDYKKSPSEGEVE